MASFELSNPPGMGDKLREQHWFSQVVRINDHYETSGQTALAPTGEIASSLPDQLDQVFKNVNEALKHAGSKGWESVYQMTSYHVGLDEEHKSEIKKRMREWMPNHQPIWTMVGVERLAIEKYKVEISVKAIS